MKLMLSSNRIVIVLWLAVTCPCGTTAKIENRNATDCGQLTRHHETPCELDVVSPVIDGEVGSTGGTGGGSGNGGNDTPSPVASPSTSPPSALSFPCRSNGGVFGTLTDIDRNIEFGYELETTTTRDITTAVILPILEQAMVDMILSEIFQDQCSDIAKRSLRVQRRMEVVGISRNPEDIVLDNVLCKDQDLSQAESSSNTCVVVSGELTIYTNTDSANSDSDKQLVLDALIRLMNEGAFVDSNNGISRVSFIQLNPTPSQTEKTDQAQPENLDGPKNRLGVYVATAGALFVLIGVAAYTRRNMGRDDNEDSTARSPRSH